MHSLAELKKKVLTVSQKSYREGLFAGTSGNLSALDKESKLVVITPTSMRYDEMTLNDLVLIDLDGNVVEGTNRPSSEWRMHCMIYKDRSDIFSVFHTHSPYATAFAVVRQSIPPILIEMIPFLGGDVPVAEPSLPGTEDLGAGALGILKERNACLLSNHGVLSIGQTVEQARIRAEYTEDAARIYHYALEIGGVKLIPEEMVHAIQQRLKLR